MIAEFAIWYVIVISFKTRLISTLTHYSEYKKTLRSTIQNRTKKVNIQCHCKIFNDRRDDIAKKESRVTRAWKESNTWPSLRSAWNIAIFPWLSIRRVSRWNKSRMFHLTDLNQFFRTSFNFSPSVVTVFHVIYRKIKFIDLECSTFLGVHEISEVLYFHQL